MPQSFDIKKFNVLQSGAASQYGHNRSLISGADGVPPVKVMPIGDPLLDNLFSGGMINPANGLQAGGIMMNSITEIFGSYSSGKTTLALEWLAAFARAYPDRGIAFIDAEASLDIRYAAHLGVPVNDARFSYSLPEEGKEAMTIVKKLMQSGMYSCIVLDSVAALQPPVSDAKDRETGDNQIAAHAKMMAESIREIKYLPRAEECTLILLNQERINLTKMGAFGKKSTGGDAVAFFSDMRISINKISKESDEREVQVVKSKCQAVPWTSANIHVKHGLGIDRLESVISLGVAANFIQTGGAGWMTMNWANMPEEASKKVQGREKLTELLYNNTVLRESLCSALGVQPFTPRLSMLKASRIEEPRE